MTPPRHTNTGPQTVFYLAVAVLVLLEQRTRLRGLLHRVGSRSDRGSLLAIAAVGAFAPRGRGRRAAWLVVRIHVEERALLDALGDPYAASPPSPIGCSPPVVSNR